MDRALLGPAFIAAAAFALVAPASAQSFVAGSFTASSTFAASSSMYGVRVHRGFDGRGGRHFPDRRRMAAAYAYASPGGYYDPGDYDANRSFDADKWNDWWHERPERAFPRWMARNRDCARQWYSGDVLTC